MDIQMDEQENGWMDEQIANGWLDQWIDGFIIEERWMYMCMYGWINIKQMDEWINDIHVDGCVDANELNLSKVVI